MPGILSIYSGFLSSNFRVFMRPVWRWNKKIWFFRIKKERAIWKYIRYYYKKLVTIRDKKIRWDTLWGELSNVPPPITPFQKSWSPVILSEPIRMNFFGEYFISSAHESIWKNCELLPNIWFKSLKENKKMLRRVLQRLVLKQSGWWTTGQSCNWNHLSGADQKILPAGWITWEDSGWWLLHFQNRMFVVQIRWAEWSSAPL